MKEMIASSESVVSLSEGASEVVRLTEAAAEHVRRALHQRGQGLGIRLRLVRAGCAGWSYRLEFVDLLQEEDQVFVSQGVKVFIKNALIPYLKGVCLDYTRKGLEEGFTFSNPRAKSTCRCGKSLSCDE